MAEDKAPNWGWWQHVPTVTIREAVALSLNLDPKKSRGLLSLHEHQEFERRQSLAMRCLGESLDGPVNWVTVAYEGEDPVIRLPVFAKWAVGIGLAVPAELSQLAPGRSGRTPNSTVDDDILDDKSVAFMPTGAPGRPSTGMHVIRIEFERRRQADECKPSLREEAKYLQQWFRGHYPKAQPPTAKTIENNIRGDYRRSREGPPSEED